MNWKAYPNFSRREMECSATGECAMTEGFMSRLQALRDAVGPLKVSSGYRSPSHPIEAGKVRPGAHAWGQAADLVVDDAARRYRIVQEAIKIGFTGIGVSTYFVHVDDVGEGFHAARPALWTY